MIEELKKVIKLLNSLKVDCETGVVIYACRNSLIQIADKLEKEEEDEPINNEPDT